ncbi:MAG TPA: hypothetical protein VGH83_08200 [Candidatus Acidoferrum sp.]
MKKQGKAVRGSQARLGRTRPYERRRERGQGAFKAIFVLVLLVLGIYCAVKLVPPYVAEYQLADKIQEQARFAIVQRYTEEQIRENVFRVMQDLDIPAKKEDIKIVANERFVKISLDYTVPVDLLTYHVDLHFTPSSENKALV